MPSPATFPLTPRDWSSPCTTTPSGGSSSSSAHGRGPPSTMPAQTTGSLPRLHAIAGWGACIAGSFDAAREHARRGLDAEAAGGVESGWLHDVLAHCAYFQGDVSAGLGPQRSRARTRTSRRRPVPAELRARRQRHPRHPGRAGADSASTGPVRRSGSPRTSTTPSLISMAQLAHGLHATRARDPLEAIQWFRRAAELADTVASTWTGGVCRGELALLLALHGDPHEAAAARTRPAQRVPTRRGRRPGLWRHPDDHPGDRPPHRARAGRRNPDRPRHRHRSPPPRDRDVQRRSRRGSPRPTSGNASAQRRPTKHTLAASPSPTTTCSTSRNRSFKPPSNTPERPQRPRPSTGETQRLSWRRPNSRAPAHRRVLSTTPRRGSPSKGIHLAGPQAGVGVASRRVTHRPCLPLASPAGAGPAAPCQRGVLVNAGIPLDGHAT